METCTPNSSFIIHPFKKETRQLGQTKLREKREGQEERERGDEAILQLENVEKVLFICNEQPHHIFNLLIKRDKEIDEEERENKR